MSGSSFCVHPDIATRYRSVRQQTLDLCKPLTAEDMMVQSCPEASPTKWHLAHTAWFFESFVLNGFLPGYRLFNSEYPWLFNSYYRSFAAFPEKRLRASFSRPGLDEVFSYREHVDEGIRQLLSADAPAEALRRIELGLNHEEQHQELLLTDILNAFFTNPLRPAYLNLDCLAGNSEPQFAVETAGQSYQEFAGGLCEVGHDGEGFCYDNEEPRHRVWLEPFALARRLATCGEYAEFIAEGGYLRPELWLSDGWDAVERNHWRAPLYWSLDPKGSQHSWRIFTLRGELSVEQMAHLPVSHVSFYEADAFARWSGKRLATELEWEVATEGKALIGNLLDSGLLHPAGAGLDAESCMAQQFGDCWEWTSSAYLGYPGYQPPAGALGEYNGKFMSGQMVLRGGSCVTPEAHIRASYRNFFAPETRWQFSGIRLAKASGTIGRRIQSKP
jgi:ergothioneine biosynthesis protein EgtB